MRQLIRIVMAIIISIPLIMISGCIGLMKPAPRDSWEGVVKRIRPAVVKVIIGQVNPLTEEEEIVGSGSGFVIGSNGIIATAAHVVSFLPLLYRGWIDVEFYNGAKYRVNGVRGSKEHDLAILQVRAVNLPTLRIEKQPLTDGEPILAMGSNGLSDFAVTDGIVSKTEIMYDDELKHGWMQSTTPINSGFSGGPIVNTRGRVVGVSIAYMPDYNEVYIFAPQRVLEDMFNSFLDLKQPNCSKGVYK